MHFDDALLLIEEQLESPERFNLDELAKALPVIASHVDGYSGKVWEYGMRLLEVAHKKNIEDRIFFEKVGWSIFESAISSCIAEKAVIRGLSFVQSEFNSKWQNWHAILDDKRIKIAIRNGLKTQRRPFVAPSELGSLSEKEQDAFAGLLRAVASIDVDDELLLQWSASIIRVCSPSSNAHVVASEVLITTLLREQRYYSAYYLFRALSKDRDELWSSFIFPKILRCIIEDYLTDRTKGVEILIDLCSDHNIENKCKSNRSLQFVAFQNL